MLIAGPCVIESEELCLNIAKQMKEITDRLCIDYYFKASFDKANRTSVESYRGPGLDKGVEILKKVKEKINVKIATDIHEPFQAEICAEVADMLQIPAFLCRQTDLVCAAAKTGKIINVKKAQFLAPWDMKNVIHKIEECGNHNILLCERGSSFGYNRLVVDFTGLIEMQSYGYPVVFDATHSVQLPGGNGNSTGGNRRYASQLAKAAVAVGVQHIFMEVHPDPDHALSDGPNMIDLQDVESLLKELLKISEIVSEGNLNV